MTNRERLILKNCNGTILIVTLWILAILTVFAVALGQRVSLEIKMAEYQRDRLEARELAKAAIERAILEKKNDTIEEIDALSESWANNELAFKDFLLGRGSFTVNFLVDGTTLYGMEDEQSKININATHEQTLVNLLKDCQVEDAERLASSILIWCGKKQDPGDEEETYYQGLDLPYHCKKEEFKSLAELLLVRHMTPEILYGDDKDKDGQISEDERGLARYLTIYGDGKININTASKRVLGALIGNNFTDLIEKVAEYRKGLDGRIGTADDRWFSSGISIVELGTGETKEVKDLKANYDPTKEDPFFSVSSIEWEKLQTLTVVEALSVNSKTYTISTHAELRKVKESIHATIDISKPGEVKYLDWHRN